MRASLLALLALVLERRAGRGGGRARRGDVGQRRVPRLDQAGRRPDDRREGRRQPPVRHFGQEHLDLRHLRPGGAAAARDAAGQRRLGERGGADQRQGARGRRATSTRSRARVRRRAGAGRLRAVLRRSRPGEHQAGRHHPDRQPHGRVRARLPVLLRPRRHDHRRARHPRRQGADGDRQLDRRARQAGRQRAELPPHPRDPPGRAAHRLPAVHRDLDQRRATAARPSTRRCSTPGEAAKFVHSARWPRAARTSSSSPAASRTSAAAASSTTASSPSTAPTSVLRRHARPSSRARSTRSRPPATASTPTASRSPARSAARCTGSRSTRRFHDGGLVAISEYEDGVRFLQIKPGRADRGAGLLPLARQLVLVAQVGGQGRRPLLDRLPARDRHPALEGRALRAGRRARAGRVPGTNGTTPLRRPPPRRRPAAARWPRSSKRPAGRPASASSRRSATKPPFTRSSYRDPPRSVRSRSLPPTLPRGRPRQCHSRVALVFHSRSPPSPCPPRLAPSRTTDTASAATPDPRLLAPTSSLA